MFLSALFRHDTRVTFAILSAVVSVVTASKQLELTSNDKERFFFAVQIQLDTYSDMYVRRSISKTLSCVGMSSLVHVSTSN